MTGESRIKILPVLVIVAMMAFSVRLVDFAAGVSSLSGKAFAESKPEAAPAPSEDATKKAEGEKESGETAQAPQPREKAPGAKDASAPEQKPAEGKAVEEKPGEKKADEKKSGEDKAAESGAGDKPGETRWRDASDEEPDFEDVKKGVFDDLSARRTALDKREKDLTTREALLKAAEQEIEMKYQELAQLRGQIEALLEKQSDEEQARAASLVKIYENMKPKEAARIFDTLDLDVLVSVVSKMSERRLSPILAAMNPERAKTVTIMLSEEKQLPTLPQGN